MLMKTKNYVDYTLVATEHAAIHERLQNWARWCKAGRTGWAMHPMWRHLVEKEQKENPVVSIPVDTLDAHFVEKAVFQLPEKHRQAVRWSYVFRGNPVGACRLIAVSKERLAELVSEGRSMLINRTRK